VTDATACIPIDTMMIGARYKSAGMIAETRGYLVIRDPFGVENIQAMGSRLLLSLPAIARNQRSRVSIEPLD
jgi:hypothetical protein